MKCKNCQLLPAEITSIISIYSPGYTEEVKYFHMWGWPPIWSQLLVVLKALTMHKMLKHKMPLKDPF